MAASQKIAEKLIGLGMTDFLAKAISEGPLDVETAITAAGNSLATSYLLTRKVNVCGTVGANTGVRPEDLALGELKLIKNGGANALSIYPHSASGTINAGTAGAAVSLATGKTYLLIRITTTDWLGIGLD